MLELVSQFKNDIKHFIFTRVDLLTRELQEKTRVVKAAVPLGILSVLLLSMAYLLLTLALVSVIAEWFRPSAYRWFFALILVGVAWTIAGSIAGMLAWHRLSEQGLLPRKTMEVLKADKMWMEEDEVKQNYEHPSRAKTGQPGVRAA